MMTGTLKLRMSFPTCKTEKIMNLKDPHQGMIEMTILSFSHDPTKTTKLSLGSDFGRSKAMKSHLAVQQTQAKVSQWHEKTQSLWLTLATKSKSSLSIAPKIDLVGYLMAMG